jgi:hypothetical protein
MVDFDWAKMRFYDLKNLVHILNRGGGSTQKYKFRQDQWNPPGVTVGEQVPMELKGREST